MRLPTLFETCERRGEVLKGWLAEADLAGAGTHFDPLEKLRRLDSTDRVEVPEQLELWQGEDDRKSAY